MTTKYPSLCMHRWDSTLIERRYKTNSGHYSNKKTTTLYVNKSLEQYLELKICEHLETPILHAAMRFSFSIVIRLVMTNALGNTIIWFGIKHVVGHKLGQILSWYDFLVLSVIENISSSA